MSLDLNTRIVTETPYSIVRGDTVVFVNVNRPSSIVLPRNGNPLIPVVVPVDPNLLQYESFYIKDFSGNSSTNPITITATDGKSIDGERFAILNADHSHMQIVYDGTNWQIIS